MKKQTSDSLEQHVGDSLDLLLHFSTKFILVSLGNLKHLVTLFLKKTSFTFFSLWGKICFPASREGQYHLLYPDSIVPGTPASALGTLVPIVLEYH